ncbi:outer membrane beta-barrel protein [Persicobacter sp. CCB-QB2]|uniref:outer membrane beta-barrel protein n=1 Tax=Persicobacter sp. CCB-QB2 TaxID=1561025 RepID=UPI0009E5EE8B|nr:outer membrane beta-barrel protein [Persicobacter sp. CCB-QB2]
MRLILTFLLTMVAGIAFSQKYGVKIGPNITNHKISASNDVEILSMDEQWGISGEFFADWDLGEDISFYTGLSVQSFGAKSKYEFDDVVTEEEIQAYYLQLPMRFRANLQLEEHLSAYAFAGPYVARSLSAKRDTVEPNGAQNVGSSMATSPKEMEPEMNPWDFGFSFGGGAFYRQLVFEVKYDMGVTNVWKLEEPIIRKSNYSFSMMFGYIF